MTQEWGAGRPDRGQAGMGMGAAPRGAEGAPRPWETGIHVSVCADQRLGTAVTLSPSDKAGPRAASRSERPWSRRSHHLRARARSARNLGAAGREPRAGEVELPPYSPRGREQHADSRSYTTGPLGPSEVKEAGGDWLGKKSRAFPGHISCGGT